MELKGQIKTILSETYGQGKTKSIVVLDTTIKPDYPEIVAITFIGKSQEALEAANLTAGTKINVHVNVKSREYNGKYYTEVTAWKFEAEAVPKSQPKPAPSQQSYLPATDDLPF